MIFNGRVQMNRHCSHCGQLLETTTEIMLGDCLDCVFMAEPEPEDLETSDWVPPDDRPDPKDQRF